MRKLFFPLLLALLMGTPAVQAKDEAGVFDYWVLALTWSPQYCNDHERDLQCLRSYNFVVHGLWPQYADKGYPEDCLDVERVDQSMVSRMATIMPSAPLVQREWQEHGSCSGLDVNEYFMTTERVHRSLIIPAVYQDVAKDLRTTVEEVKNTFIESNSQLSPSQLSLSCKGRYLTDVRICYDKDFQPRDCGAGMRDRCGKRVILRPTR